MSLYMSTHTNKNARGITSNRFSRTSLIKPEEI
jgi:hypothetical protein